MLVCKSKFCLLLMLVFGASAACADGIVYFDQAQVQNVSVVLKDAEQKINNDYDEKIKKLELKQTQLSQELNKDNVRPEVLAMSSQIQESVTVLNNEKDVQARDIQSKFFTLEKGVVEKLRQKKGYTYILSSKAVFSAAPGNDISVIVAKLTDGEYKKIYKAH